MPASDICFHAPRKISLCPAFISFHVCVISLLMAFAAGLRSAVEQSPLMLICAPLSVP